MEAAIANFSTPANTTGMGCPSIGETPDDLGSGDTFCLPPKQKKKKMKSLKDFVKQCH